MIQTSDAWSVIYADRYHQTKTTITVDGVTIPDTRIAAKLYVPVLTSAIYTREMTVGNCVSSCFEFTYLPSVDPPKGAIVKLYCTIYPRDGSWSLSDEYEQEVVDENEDVIEADTAETILIGTYRIGTRSKNNNGWLTLVCFDKLERLDRVTVLQAAKKCNLVLPDPCGVKDGIVLLQTYTGMTCQQLPANATFTHEELKQLTLREFAGYLAAQAGGSFASDETGENIKLLPLKPNLPDEYYLTDEDDSVLEDEQGNPIFVVDEKNQRYFLDDYRVGSLDDLGTLDPITGVLVIGSSLEDDSYLAGDETGTVLSVEFPFKSASKKLASSILTTVSGYIHNGWNADRVILDPAFQIGDSMVVGNRETVLAEYAVTIGGAYIAGAGAAINEEVNIE